MKWCPGDHSRFCVRFWRQTPFLIIAAEDINVWILWEPKDKRWAQQDKWRLARSESGEERDDDRWVENRLRFYASFLGRWGEYFIMFGERLNKAVMTLCYTDIQSNLSFMQIHKGQTLWSSLLGSFMVKTPTVLQSEYCKFEIFHLKERMSTHLLLGIKAAP